MNIKSTNKQKLYRKEPTRLEVLREINKRKGLENQPKLKMEFNKLERGYEGEAILLDYLEKYGEDDWIVLRNVWLNFFGGFECDVLLVTRTGLYPFEVKNYANTFHLKDNIGKINDIELSKHPVSQAQNAVISLNAMFKNSSTPPKIIGSVIFIGSDSKVDIQDEIINLHLLVRSDLKDFILDIRNHERNYNRRSINSAHILEVLDQHEITNPFPALNLYLELKHQIQPGIICSHCGNFILDITRTYVVCGCGMHESRDEAIVRTICEYGVMNFDHDLTTTELVEFFDKQISRTNIQRVLNDYFKRNGFYKGTHFENTQSPFPDIYHNFTFTTSKYKIFHGPELN